MGLTTSLNTALSSFHALGVQTEITARNINGVNDPSYTRKSVDLATRPHGGVEILGVSRAMNDALFRSQISSFSQSRSDQVVVDKFTALGQIVGDPEDGTSLSGALGQLNTSLQSYAVSPQDPLRAQDAVMRASGLVSALHDATDTVQEVRAQSDFEMTNSVSKINQWLGELEDLNAEIVSKYSSPEDITTQLDARDKLILNLSGEIGLRVVEGNRGSVALYTDGGTTLFETVARPVTFEPTSLYQASTTGNAVYIDGVAVTGSSATMPIKTGALAGLAQVRDTLAPQVQTQLDEVARGVIFAFRESDPAAIPSLPDLPGLFTYSGAPAMPPSGSVTVGLAADIQINAGALSNPSTIRDGAMNGNMAYLSNTTGAAGYADRINQLIGRIETPQSFALSAGLETQTTLVQFTASSAGWLEAQRAQASTSADASTARAARASEALNQVTGVNMDMEMMKLSQLQSTYKATAQLVKVIDQMIQDLLSAVR